MRGIVAVVVALLCGATATSAAAALPTLAGTTVIAGSKPARVRVVVPHAARLPTLSTPDFGQGAWSATGGGRFLGFVLRPAGAPVTGDTPTVVGGKLNHCYAPACQPAAVTEQRIDVFSFAANPAGGFTIPAGTYDLYLLADGAPVKLTLKLAGLSGTTTLRPSGPVAAKIDSPAPALAIGGQGAAFFTAGSVSPIGAPGGMFFLSALVDGTGPGADLLGRCIFTNGPPPQNIYHRPCLGGDDTGFVQNWGDEISGEVTQPVLTGPVPNLALGGYGDGVFPQGSFHVVSATLTYR
jgi:hypothetical protein